MQRNMLLAIALSILVMILWQKYFGPPPPERQGAIDGVYEQAPDQPPLPDRFPDQFDREPLPLADPSLTPEVIPFEELAKAQEIMLESAQLSATFTSHGGRLVSLSLNNFDSKRGGNVEIIPAGEDSQWPLALTFNDPAFGVRDESFIYDHSVYEPSDGAIIDLAMGLRACSASIFPQAEASEIARQIEACIPDTGKDNELRRLVIALAAEEAAKTKSAESISKVAEALAGGKHLVFSRRLTSSITLIKAFSFPEAEYSFDMHVVVHNTGAEPLNLGRGRSAYSVVWLPGMETSERNMKSDPIQAVSLVGESYQQKALKKFKEAVEFPDTLRWIGLKRKFFFLALEPEDGLTGASIKTEDVKKEKLRIELDMSPMIVEADGVAADTIRISTGPMHTDVLDSLGSSFDLIINFGFFDFFGKILLTGLLWFNKYVQNYGIAIILLTVVVRVGLFPLNQKSYKSMKEMQAVQPLVTELREKHKDNPQEMNKKMMALYREHKVNPLGGCLPMVFQMPIFIALFQALRNAVELRGAEFLWITDLSEPDRLYTLQKLLKLIHYGGTTQFDLPLNLLPLLVIVAMLVQQKMTPMAMGGQNETQQKMMQYMPIFFGFIFYNMPSGLTVYFLVTTVLGLVQQYFVQKAA